MQNFDAYLRVESVRLVDVTPDQEKVLVKAESQAEATVVGGTPPVSLHLIMTPGLAPTPGDILRVTVERAATAVRPLSSD